MKRWPWLIAYGISTFALAQNERASSNDLLRDCSVTERYMNGDKNVDNYASLACLGYVSGYTDAVHVHSRAVCMPPGVTNGQLVRVVVK
jgi:hypothetical protein